VIDSSGLPTRPRVGGDARRVEPWIAATVLAALFGSGALGAAPSEVTPPTVLTTGLYVQAITWPNGREEFAYLHFYESGHVGFAWSGLAAVAAAKQWPRLLAESNRGTGTYTEREGRLEIDEGVVDQRSMKTRYTATLAPSALRLERLDDPDRHAEDARQIGLWPGGDYRHVAVELPAGAVRSDGVYWCGSPMSQSAAEILRFWSDGTVAAFSGSLDPTNRAFHQPRGMYGSRGRFEVSGQELALEFGGRRFPGFFEGETIRLDRACPGLGRLVTQGYRFEPVAGLDSAPKPWVAVTFGRVSAGTGCDDLEFVPVGSDLAVAKSDGQMAFRLAFTAVADLEAKPKLGFRVPEALCGGEFVTKVCGEEVVLRGEPFTYQVTGVIRCSGDRAFRPGFYQFEALIGGEPDVTVPFRVP
jgi:hypothetical protein